MTGYISTSLNTYLLTLLFRAIVAEVGVTHKGARKGTSSRVAARTAHWSSLALGGYSHKWRPMRQFPLRRLSCVCPAAGDSTCAVEGF